MPWGQPWPMEVIVGLTLVVSFATVVWIVIGVIAMIQHYNQRR